MQLHKILNVSVTWCIKTMEILGLEKGIAAGLGNSIQSLGSQ